jgi:hypothetical protein
VAPPEPGPPEEELEPQALNNKPIPIATISSVFTHVP